MATDFALCLSFFSRITPAVRQDISVSLLDKVNPRLVFTKANRCLSLSLSLPQKILKQEPYDDGSIGPVLVRLAWHASGTYCKETDTGGSNGAGMRYEAEGGDPANAGLQHARVFLEPIKEKHPWITYADCE